MGSKISRPVDVIEDSFVFNIDAGNTVCKRLQQLPRSRITGQLQKVVKEGRAEKNRIAAPALAVGCTYPTGSKVLYQLIQVTRRHQWHICQADENTRTVDGKVTDTCC